MNPAIGLAWNPAVGIPMLFVGIVVMVLLWLFGQPRKEQGRRKPVPEQPERARERREPVFSDEDGGADAREAYDERDNVSFSARDELREDDANDPLFNPRPKQAELDVDLRAELERLGASLAGERTASAAPVAPAAPAPAASAPVARPAQRTEPRFDLDLPFNLDDEPRVAASAPTPVPAPAPVPVRPPAPAPAPVAKTPPRSDLGRRPPHAPVERIVSLYVVAREGTRFNGSDLVVAAEKAGLEFGDMGIYHRLVDGHPEQGPIFSVANLTKPGNFDMARIATLQTSGLSFFMALPGPVPALDAWDAMLPTAQRLGELLDGLVLDEERNALGRQRIAHIRDELRGWDRGHEGEEIKFGQ
ncbi:cell division protein ZipA [Luteibacter sp. 22Crub2.1]|uniref:cell division protein ZipA n=1 Tax=Luteibacter sp. 22Crub2.1 TaxID=1283288 RepID=UPI0009A90061|nr:cell division protein ZipA [Luteibacter sp. 22Crub2.1]SKB62959.1 cell division protein ZipA [Luteibacter sp. 22Crub2.1]